MTTVKVANHFRVIFTGRYLLMVSVSLKTYMPKYTGIACPIGAGYDLKEAVVSSLISLRLSSYVGSLLGILQ